MTTSIPLKRFTAEQLASRDRELALALEGRPSGYPGRWYSETELDALDETDPRSAAEIARRQATAVREAETRRVDGPLPELTEQGVCQALEEARRILARDGGDLEFVALEGTAVRVRLKGACVGCPNAVIDLRNVVEKTLRRHFPQISGVLNTY
jgi:toxin CptA